MKIIVDTNIVFSGILNIHSRIGGLLIQAPTEIEFYSCEFLQYEIKKHRAKLLKITKMNEADLLEIEQLVMRKIHFISDSLLDEALLDEVEEMLADIDIDDAPFVALSKQLDAKLWTGDKKLIEGLKRKEFSNLITTDELRELFEQL